MLNARVGRALLVRFTPIIVKELTDSIKLVRVVWTGAVPNVAAVFSECGS